jgi:hypothetical protein
VVDRTLTMQGQCLLSPLTCFIELAKLSMGPCQMKADHCLIDGRPTCTDGAVEQVQGSPQGLLRALWGAELQPDLALMRGELLLREGKQAPLLLFWRNLLHRLSRSAMAASAAARLPRLAWARACNDASLTAVAPAAWPAASRPEVVRSTTS